MQVEDSLPRMLTIINHQSVSLLQTLLLCNAGCSHHHLAQDDLVPILSAGDSSESVLVLGDDEDVGGRHGSDVAEGEDEVVLEDHLRGYFLADQFVEDRLLRHPTVLIMIYQYKRLILLKIMRKYEVEGL